MNTCAVFRTFVQNPKKLWNSEKRERKTERIFANRRKKRGEGQVRTTSTEFDREAVARIRLKSREEKQVKSAIARKADR